jgi:hypothetical protein
MSLACTVLERSQCQGTINVMTVNASCCTAMQQHGHPCMLPYTTILGAATAACAIAVAVGAKCEETVHLAAQSSHPTRKPSTNSCTQLVVQLAASLAAASMVDLSPSRLQLLSLPPHPRHLQKPSVAHTHNLTHGAAHVDCSHRLQQASPRVIRACPLAFIHSWSHLSHILNTDVHCWHCLQQASPPVI